MTTKFKLEIEKARRQGLHVSLGTRLTSGPLLLLTTAIRRSTARHVVAMVVVNRSPGRENQFAKHGLILLQASCQTVLEPICFGRFCFPAWSA
jgi:hypothetical protein